MQLTIILQIIAAFNFFMIVGLIWYLRQKVNAPIKIFSYFLLGKGITLVSNLIFVTAHADSDPLVISLGTLMGSFLLFYAPILYFFAAAIVKKPLSMTQKAIHFVPFMIYAILNITAVASYHLSLTTTGFFESLVTLINNISLIYYFQVIGYTSLAIYTLNRNKKNQGIHSKIISDWLKRILVVFLMIWFLFLGVYVSSAIFHSPTAADVFKFAGVLCLLVLSSITLLISLKNPESFFNNLSLKLEKVEPINKELTKSNFEKICHTIEQMQLYKNPDFKVGDLAKEVNISARNISSIIKTFSGTNFNHLINSYRIEEAKRLLEDDSQERTILTILLEAGFNSKSVFNTVFKKYVGVTPSVYRDDYLMSKYNQSKSNLAV